MRKTSQSLFFLWICLSQMAVGDYDVSVRLLEYSRDQDCGCDPGLWGCNECDVYFQICLQPLSPTQEQICYGNNQDDRVNDTNHFLFAGSLWDHDIFRWRNISGLPTFEILIYVFDYDDIDVNETLGVTNYTYQGNSPTVQNVTTNLGNKNLRIELTLTVSCLCFEQENITNEHISLLSTLPTDTTSRTPISNAPTPPSAIGRQPSSSKSTGAFFNTAELLSGITKQHNTGGGLVSLSILGQVSDDQLQNLSLEMSKILDYQNHKDVVLQSVDISSYYNITDQSLTKIHVVYNCTQCDQTADWVKGKVRSALQKLNLTQYEGDTNGRSTITNYKSV